MARECMDRGVESHCQGRFGRIADPSLDQRLGAGCAWQMAMPRLENGGDQRRSHCVREPRLPQQFAILLQAIRKERLEQPCPRRCWLVGGCSGLSGLISRARRRPGIGSSQICFTPLKRTHAKGPRSFLLSTKVASTFLSLILRRPPFTSTNPRRRSNRLRQASQRDCPPPVFSVQPRASPERALPCAARVPSLSLRSRPHSP
jgi:hypothetical protein